MSRKRKREEVFSDEEEISHKISHTDAHCPICIDSDNEEPFEFLSCAHSFHPSCIAPWLKKSRRCPVCRSIVRALTAQEMSSRIGDWFSESEDDEEDDENVLYALNPEFVTSETNPFVADGNGEHWTNRFFMDIQASEDEEDEDYLMEENISEISSESDVDETEEEEMEEEDMEEDENSSTESDIDDANLSDSDEN